MSRKSMGICKGAAGEGFYVSRQLNPIPMSSMFLIILSVVVACIGLVIGNWLSLIPYTIAVMIVPKHSMLINQYIARISMGLAVGALFVLLAYWGLRSTTLIGVFLLWAIFMSEPPLMSNSGQILSHDILKGNLKKYNLHKAGLKTARIIAYIIAFSILSSFI